jgi:uncharacterized membrane protein YeaQ/YmgE (transglycosylase-associated protein family)
MSLVSLIIVLVVAGFAVWAINMLIPMDGRFKTVLNAVVGIFLCLWLLQQFGLLSGGPVLRLR